MDTNGSTLDLANAKYTIKETTYPDVVEIELRLSCMIDTPFLVRLLESE